jgi:hypothetical protein
VMILVIDLIIISSRQRAVNDPWLKSSVTRLGVTDLYYIMLIFYNLS